MPKNEVTHLELFRSSKKDEKGEIVLKIPVKKYTEESTLISIRLPKDMLRDIDEIAKKTGRTRNELLTTSLEFALNHMEITKE